MAAKAGKSWPWSFQNGEMMQGAWLLDMVRVHTILGVVFEFDPIYCAGGVGDLNPTHQCAKVLSFTFFSSHGKKKRVNSDSDNGPLPCGCRYRLSDLSQSPALHSGNWVHRFRHRFSGVSQSPALHSCRWLSLPCNGICRDYHRYCSLCITTGTVPGTGT